MTWLLASWVTVIVWLAGAALDQIFGGRPAAWIYSLLVAFPLNYLLSEFFFYLLGILVTYALVWWGVHFAVSGWESRGRWPDPLVIVLRALDRRGQNWPLGLLVPLTVLLIGALVAVLLGSMHAYHWELFAVLVLGLWAHYLAEPESEAIEEWEEEVPARQERWVSDEPMPASQFVRLLRADPSYRGQICWQRERPATETRFYSGGSGELLQSRVVLSALERLGIDGLRGLYSHQGAVLEQLSKPDPERGRRNHVLLCTPRGSGRSTISALAALHRVLDRQCNVLFVYPTKRVGELEEARFKRILRAAGLRWSADWDTIWDSDEYERKAPSTELAVPEVLFTTVRMFHRHILPDHRKWAAFLRDLDLIVADDLELFQGAFGSNSAFVFRRLRRLCALHGANPQFLAVCLPVRNYHSFAVRLLGVRFEQKAIIATDSRATAERVVVFWNPPLDRPEKEDSGYIVARRPYFREARELLLKTALHRLHPILLSKAVRMTLCDVQDFGHLLTEQLRELTGRETPIPVGTSVAETEVPEEGFNSVIMAGFPGPSSMVRHELEHMRGDEGPDDLLCVVTPQTPLAQYYLRRGDRYLDFKDRASSMVISNDNDNMVRNHLKCALREQPVGRDEIEEYFGGIGPRIVDEMTAAGETRWEQRDEFLGVRPVTYEVLSLTDTTGEKPQDDISLYSSSLAQVPVRIRAEGEVVDAIDSNRVPDLAYPGAVYYFEDERYDVVGQSMAEAPSVELELCEKPLETHKLSKVVVDIPDGEKYLHEHVFDVGRPMLAGWADGRVQEKVIGRVEYDFEGESFSGSRLQHIVEFPGDGLDRASFQTEVGFVTFRREVHPEVSEEVMHSLVHLCKALLPVFILGGEKECGMDYDMAPPDLGAEPTLFFYDNLEHGLGYAHLMLDHIRELFTEAYEVLKTCPCAEGCEACLKIPDCHRLGPNKELNWGLDKSNTMRLLGYVLSKEGFEPIIRDRTDGMEDIDRVGQLKDRIARELFENKLGMHIEKPAIVSFMTEEEQRQRPGVAGFYEGGEKNRVSVTPVMEGTMVGLLAHEYAHNWQFEPGNMHPRLVAPDVPFQGRLLLEGFAQWVEYKICDFYGLKNEMAAVDFAHPDQCNEYSEGFQVIKYLEDIEGVRGVLEFVSTGGLGGPHEDLEQLYEDAGVAQDIYEKVRRLEEGGWDLPDDDWIGLSDWLAAFPGAVQESTEPEAEPGGEEPATGYEELESGEEEPEPPESALGLSEEEIEADQRQE